MRVAVKLLIALLSVLDVAFVLVWIAAGSLHYVTRIYGPTLEFSFPYRRMGEGECGPSTDNLEDLILDESITEQQATERMDTHGAVVIPNLLQEETAQKFRDYVMHANLELDQVHVTNPENRYHISPPHTEPIVQTVFGELAEHPILRPLLDNLLGPKASLVIFSVVTSTYGAEDQAFHPDAGSSVTNYPDLIVPEYQLAIALQDTTKEMGATAIIPGTHPCAWPAIDWDTLREDFFSNETLVEQYNYNFDSYIEVDMKCDVRATLNQGGGFLYHTRTLHRGVAHTDPNAPQRALAFFTFAGSRQGPDDHRSLPLGQVYALNWNMWGRTVEDMATLRKGIPWRFWRAFGLWGGNDDVRPWNLVDDFLRVFKHEDELSYAFSGQFTRRGVEELSDLLLFYAYTSTVLYLVVATPLLVSLVYRR